ncbi:thiamine phosphate synthase [Pararhodobacter zhoushanensis]|uniref:Thiamine phosphate synthase n=1 Tax=Pararhodobacter zhoushanensis TaxID=2479545 RepID=A0ABT3H066_9RHOB|nr:thiamine phosphate synthase [Pararhodobacter zhoushanensis]MCW1933184.1 thiamine phosphate synthase [Pararhodobacter zhoushanensis]
MSDTTPERPQLYLITPAAFDPDVFAPRLARVLDGVEVACLRLAMAGQDEDAISRAADALREVAHARDIALVIERHVVLAERLGLDGVHLPQGARDLRKLRKTLGDDAIIGTACGTSRHDGLTAAEAGADYVAFGPMGETGLGTGGVADIELFSWWSEVIEVPVVAEGALTQALVETLTPITDFFAIGDEIWGQDDPLAALKTLVAPAGY